jgi:hypothetical protein
MEEYETPFLRREEGFFYFAIFKNSRIGFNGISGFL